MGWRAYPDTGRKVLFFWSQKAACTSLFRLLADNMADPPEKKRYFIDRSVPHATARRLIETQGWRAAILARHPASRLLSSYLNKFVTHYGRPLHHHRHLEPFARELHLDICAAAGRPAEDNLTTFEEFLDAVARQIAARPDPWSQVNGHWDTQAPPGQVGQPLAYDRVLRVERMETDLATLAAELRMAWTAPRLNATDYGEGAGGYLGDRTPDELNRLRFRPGNFLTPANLERIAALHASDYRLFGYEVAPPAGQPDGSSASISLPAP